MGQRRHHRHLRRIQPLIGHGDGHQHRRLRCQPEGRQGLLRATLVGDCQRHAHRLGRRYPAAQDLEVAPRLDLVGRHHQQLAEAARGLARRGTQGQPTLGPQLARRLEGPPQQALGEAGAQRGEQRRPGGLLRRRGLQPVRPEPRPLAAALGLRPQPGRLAVQRAEGDRQHRPLRQGPARL